MKGMEKALKSERVKYNQQELKRTNRVAKLVLQKREEEGGVTNGGGAPGL